MLERQVCAICLENISPSTELARPSACEHKFCRGCLERHCLTSQSPRRCPLDRKTFDKICVLGPTGETLFDAATMTQLGRIFVSPAVPASLGCLLLAVLWVSPNWPLALHIASIGAVYWYTDGVTNWDLYTLQSMGFYFCLVPMKFFGFWLPAYAWACGILVFYMCRQVPDLTSTSVTPEKVLLFFTCPIISLIVPGLVFSIYSLAQTFCYTICVLVIIAMQAKLSEAFCHLYVCYSVLFSSLVLAPFLCLLSDLTLPHLMYQCLLAAYFLFVANSTAGPSEDLRRNIHLMGLGLSKMACFFAPSVILGCSPWTALYSVAILGFVGFLTQSGLFTKLYQSVPLLVLVNYATVGLFLPWLLFGLLPYLATLVPVCASCLLTDLVAQRVSLPANALPFFHLLLQFAVLGILLSAAIFAPDLVLRQ